MISSLGPKEPFSKNHWYEECEQVTDSLSQLLKTLGYETSTA
jgi:hypothetical protein